MPKSNSGGKRAGRGGGGTVGKLDPQQEGKYLYTQKNLHSTAELEKAVGEERTQRMLYSVASTLSEFGLQEGNVTELGAQRAGKGVYAFSVCNGDQIRVNTDMFKNEEKLNASYENDVKHGFHPKGTSADDIIVHETGHNVMYALERDHVGAVDRVFRNAAKEVTGSAKTGYVTLAKTISGYATKNRAECFAEAVADYMRNGSNATAASRAIVKYAKIELGVK